MRSAGVGLIGREERPFLLFTFPLAPETAYHFSLPTFPTQICFIGLSLDKQTPCFWPLVWHITIILYVLAGWDPPKDVSCKF